jgi:methyl-accepting chemotaxis protein
MSIAKKLILSFVIVLFTSILVSGIGIWSIQSLSSTLDEINDDTLPQVQLIGKIKASLVDFRNRETQLLIARNAEELTDTIQRMNKNLGELQAADQELQIHLSDEEKSLHHDFQNRFATFLTSHQIYEQLIRDGKKEEALDRFAGETRKNFRETLPVVDRLVELFGNEANQDKQNANHLVHTTQIAMISATVLALICSLGLSVWLYQTTIPELHKIRSVTALIAKERDFTQRIDIDTSDEIGETAQAVNQVIATMQSSLRELLDGILMNASASEQLSQAAQQASSSSVQQSDAATTMAAAMEQLTVSMGQVARNAGRASELSQLSGDASQKGEQVITASVQQMREIAHRIQQTAHAVQQLGESSKEISGIVEVIRDVADQTNLLALNAAIEAARAGEQGRGFAVVADEVRNLAARTALATSDISTKIAGIQSGVDSATHNMDSAVALVETGVGTVDSAGESVKLINNRIQEAESEVNAISLALKEQSEASNQIAVNVEHIARMSEQNRTAAAQAASLSQNLSNRAEAMRQIAQRFRV